MSAWFQGVWDAVALTVDFVRELGWDGFLAVLAVAVAGPLVGVVLILRRLPMLALAVPEAAAVGQVAALLCVGWVAAELDDAHPWAQVAGGLTGVLVALLWIGTAARGTGRTGMAAALVYLTCLALRELLIHASPPLAALDEQLHHGRVLAVLESGRWRVLGAAVLTTGAVLSCWRPLVLTAFDPDESRLLGFRPGIWLGVTVVLLGILSATAVPVLGPPVVLTLILIPPAVLRPAVPSVRTLLPLSVLAGVLGALSAYVLSVAWDWPTGASLVMTTLLASALVAAATFGVTQVSFWTARLRP